MSDIHHPLTALVRGTEREHREHRKITSLVNKKVKMQTKGFTEVLKSKVFFFEKDNGGRRLGIERRQFSYSTHIPERRCGEDRRSGLDRRNDISRRMEEERRAALT